MKKTSGPYMTPAQWFGTFILMAIPIVNVVCVLVWLFGGGKKQERTNMIRGYLLGGLIVAAVIGIIAIVLVVMGISFDEIFDSVNNGTATASQLLR